MPAGNFKITKEEQLEKFTVMEGSGSAGVDQATTPESQDVYTGELFDDWDLNEDYHYHVLSAGFETPLDVDLVGIIGWAADQNGTVLRVLNRGSAATITTVLEGGSEDYELEIIYSGSAGVGDYVCVDWSELELDSGNSTINATPWLPMRVNAIGAGSIIVGHPSLHHDNIGGAGNPDTTVNIYNFTTSYSYNLPDDVTTPIDRILDIGSTISMGGVVLEHDNTDVNPSPNTFQLGRLFLQESFQPAVNMDLRYVWKSISQHRIHRMTDKSIRTDSQVKKRYAKLTLPELTGQEKIDLDQIFIDRGVEKDVILKLYPGHTTAAFDDYYTAHGRILPDWDFRMVHGEDGNDRVVDSCTFEFEEDIYSP